MLQASVLLLAAFCSWGSRGGGPGCSWWCVPAWQPWARAGGGLGRRALHSPQPRRSLCHGFLPARAQAWGSLDLDRHERGEVRMECGEELLISALSHCVWPIHSRRPGWQVSQATWAGADRTPLPVPHPGGGAL